MTKPEEKLAGRPEEASSAEKAPNFKGALYGDIDLAAKAIGERAYKADTEMTKGERFMGVNDKIESAEKSRSEAAAGVLKIQERVGRAIGAWQHSFADDRARGITMSPNVSIEQRRKRGETTRLPEVPLTADFAQNQRTFLRWEDTNSFEGAQIVLPGSQAEAESGAAEILKASAPAARIEILRALGVEGLPEDTSGISEDGFDGIILDVAERAGVETKRDSYDLKLPTNVEGASVRIRKGSVIEKGMPQKFRSASALPTALLLRAIVLELDPRRIDERK